MTKTILRHDNRRFQRGWLVLYADTDTMSVVNPLNTMLKRNRRNQRWIKPQWIKQCKDLQQLIELLDERGYSSMKNWIVGRQWTKWNHTSCDDKKDVTITTDVTVFDGYVVCVRKSLHISWDTYLVANPSPNLLSDRPFLRTSFLPRKFGPSNLVPNELFKPVWVTRLGLLWNTLTHLQTVP